MAIRHESDCSGNDFRVYHQVTTVRHPLSRIVNYPLRRSGGPADGQCEPYEIPGEQPVTIHPREPTNDDPKPRLGTPFRRLRPQLMSRRP